MEVRHPNYTTSKTKEEIFAVENFVNPLPRTVIRANTPVLLDGEWNFSLDAEDVGLQDSWHLGHTYVDKANWPGSIEDHIAKAKGQAATSWQDKIVAWYERDFPLPEYAGCDSTNSILQLTFGACGYETRVWLNGLPLTTIEGEQVHVGEYTSFSYEL